MAKRMAFVLGICLIVSLGLRAQEVTGRLEGRVLDHEGLALPSIRAVLTGDSLQGTRETESDKRGYFRFFSLPSGVYALRLLDESFHEFARENIRVPLGGTAFVGDIQLKPIYMESHDIVVVGQPPLLDPTSTVSGANLVADTIKDLPLGRDYRSAMAILPGANQSSFGDDVNVSGATGSENMYSIDGIDVSDPFMRFKNTALPYNFVKEIEVRAGGYEAQYRSSMGGLVNAVTFSGGNDFSGQVFGFFTNNNFSQSAFRAALEPSKGRFAQYDMGLSLGGPIVRDRLWFYAAYNSINRGEDVLIPGLDLYLRDKRTQDVFAGKLTWRPSEIANLTFTMIGDPVRHDYVGPGQWATVAAALNPDPMLARITEGGYNFLASGSFVLGRNLVLETSLAHVIRRDRIGPATEVGETEVLYLDIFSGGIMSGGHWGKDNGDSYQTTAACKGTLVLGSHVLKAGFEYRDNRLDADRDQESLVRFSENMYTHMPGVSRGTVRNRIPSLFAQDSWKVSDRLNVNLGLRWSAENLVGSDGRVCQRIPDEFQPRLGFVFRPDGKGASKISGSFGRFYGELSTYVMTWYMIEGAVWHSIAYDHDPRLDPSGGSDTATSGVIQPEIEGLRGQHYDEFTLGYERVLGGSYKFGLTGIFRDLRAAIEDTLSPRDGTLYVGNPGRPPLDETAKMTRRYLGLQMMFQRTGGKHLDFTVSYTLSRSHGNYPGLFAHDMDDKRPNTTGYVDTPEQVALATGLLPNDRPHVFKIFGSYRFPFGLSVGTFFQWQSGTPLSELGTQTQLEGWWKFIAPRGTLGRTPAIADLNLRLTYQMKSVAGTRIAPRLVLDAFHIGSRRTPVTYEQRHYLGVDESGTQIDPNPLYMQPTRFFPPMSARLGMEVNF